MKRGGTGYSIMKTNSYFQLTVKDTVKMAVGSICGNILYQNVYTPGMEFMGTYLFACLGIHLCGKILPSS